MSETKTTNAMMFTPPQLSLLELAKDSAAVAAHMATIAMQADDRNMHNMRNAFSALAQVFTTHAQKLTDECIVAAGQTSH